jgi:hypothetical protein
MKRNPHFKQIYKLLPKIMYKYLYLATVSGSKSFVAFKSSKTKLGHSASFLLKWLEVVVLLWTDVFKLFPGVKVEFEVPGIVSTHALIQVSVVCTWVLSIPKRSKAHLTASYVVDCLDRPRTALIFGLLVRSSLKVAFSVLFHCKTYKKLKKLSYCIFITR